MRKQRFRFLSGAFAALLAFLLLAVSAPASAGSLILPAELKTVSDDAFREDTAIRTVVLQEGITSIGSGAFADSGVTEITLPASVTSIADDAFDGVSLTTVHAAKGTYAYEWMRDKGYIAEYRALLIGEQCFLWFDDEEDPESGCWLDDDDQRNIGDTINLAAALGNTAGPRGAEGPAGSGFKVTRKTNLSYYGIRSAISSTFADTRDQDTSVLFIATHGNSEGDGELRTAFVGEFTDTDIASYWEHRYLSFGTLASWLTSSVRGRVFVILESCGSGSAVYAENAAGNGAKRRTKDASAAAEKFVESAVEAFSLADPGLPLQPGETEGTLTRNTGELRLPKFYVLAASQHMEDSYGWETHEPEDSFNYFTHWLIEGIGKKDDPHADTNHDNLLNLHELYTYIQQYDTHPFVIDGTAYYQHVRAYPGSSLYSLLKLVK